MLPDHGLGSLPCLAHRPGGFGLGLAQQPLLFLERPAGLLDFIRKAEPEVVDAGQRFFLVDDHGPGERDLTAVRDQVFEAVDGFMDVHASAPLM